MHGVYTAAEVRAAEDVVLARLPQGALMARAAYALAVECARILGAVYGARVVLLVGVGNNGGDALYAGAELARRGARVTALLLDRPRAHAGGLAALIRAGGVIAAAEPRLVAGADLVIDGMFGIGGRGELRPEAAALARAAGAVTVAVDIPSGVDADTGEVAGVAVEADVTVTFGALKAGLLVGAGAEHAGEVRLVDIGLEPSLLDAPLSVLEERDVRALLSQPGAADDKYTRGVVGIVAGSSEYPGAGLLATSAAVAGGAGMVRYAGTAPDLVRTQLPEVVVHEPQPAGLRVQSWVVGPGMGTDDAAAALLREVLASAVPVIVDADAITLAAGDLAMLTDRAAGTVVTPHDREFVRIAGALGQDRVAAARRAARELGVTVLLKGNATVIAAPDGSAFVNPTGTPWLATAGSGDVLSGLIGTLLASGLSAPLAAAVGAYVHGVAGQIAAAGGPPSAADIARALRPALRTISADLGGVRASPDDQAQASS